MLSRIGTALIFVSLVCVAAVTTASAIVPAPPHRSGGPGAATISRPPAGVTAPPAPKFETLMAFGAGAVLLMLVCWCHERCVPSAAAGTAASALAASVYGFAQGAWPLGIAMLAFAVVSGRRWWASPVPRGRARRTRPVACPKDDPDLSVETTVEPWQEESRVTRLFGRH